MKQTQPPTRRALTSPHLVQPVEVGREPLVRLCGSFLTYLGNALLEDGLNAVLLDVVFAVLDGSGGGSHFLIPSCVARRAQKETHDVTHTINVRAQNFWLLGAY